jgi:hypothetical protein
MVEHCKMMKHQEDMEASTIQDDLKNSPFHKILLLSLETTQTPHIHKQCCQWQQLDDNSRS